MTGDLYSAYITGVLQHLTQTHPAVRSCILDLGTDDLDNTIAAIDLGSNSFHLILAEVRDQQIHIIERDRQRIQLAAGLNHLW